MNSKEYFVASIIKSGLRIAGCLAVAVWGEGTVFRTFAYLFCVAEMAGILEEVFDER